ncbi:winged helix-turn-helix transcriptional regulator [Bradyrhizobium sp. LeoA1S1]
MLDVVGDGWSLLIVRDAFEGLNRFGEFQKSLGLAKNILSARLRDLVRYGVFKVVPTSDGSPYNAYVLTEKGQGLRPGSGRSWRVWRRVLSRNRRRPTSNERAKLSSFSPRRVLPESQQGSPR